MFASVWFFIMIFAFASALGSFAGVILTMREDKKAQQVQEQFGKKLSASELEGIIADGAGAFGRCCLTSALARLLVQTPLKRPVITTAGAQSGPGATSVTKAQFVVSMLKKLELCDDDDVKQIMVRFLFFIIF